MYPWQLKVFIPLQIPVLFFNRSRLNNGPYKILNRQLQHLKNLSIIPIIQIIIGSTLPRGVYSIELGLHWHTVDAFIKIIIL